MSAALSAAKKRRAPIAVDPPIFRYTILLGVNTVESCDDWF